MPFVLDASITAAWTFEDEDHPHAAVAFDLISTDSALVPSLWWFEVRNMLLINERRRRLTPAKTALFLHDLSNFAIVQDHMPDEAEIMRLARTHQLTVYDATYLELAQRSGCALATLDSALVRAAHAESVPILGES